MKKLLSAIVVILALLAPSGAVAAEPTVIVGSKAFAESWILGEALAALARRGAAVEHKRNLGGTEVVWQALTTGSVDVYAEYTGTIAEVILGGADHPAESFREELGRRGVGMSAPLGFEDGYALAVTRGTAVGFGLLAISDLLRHPDLRAAFSLDFLGRMDGYPGLASRYGLNLSAVRGIQHELSYEALLERAGGRH